jgi:chromate transport protein ChrA
VVPQSLFFLGLVAAYWDRLALSVFAGLYAAIGCVLSQSVHKLFKSYPQKKEIRLAFLFFYKTAKKRVKYMILWFFIFVELEINMWITMGRRRVVADN